MTIRIIKITATKYPCTRREINPPLRTSREKRDPPSRIVWTNEEGGDDGSVTTITFEEHDDRTLVVVSEQYPSKEALDAAGTGAAEALDESFAQLEELLSEP